MSLHPRDSWNGWKQFTDARIGLGRSGRSLRTQDHLAFELAFAKAKDSLYKEINWEQFQSDLNENLQTKSIMLYSQAKNLDIYLTRPDLGRKLFDTSISIDQDRTKLQVGIAITNGLSSQAISNHAIEFLKIFLSLTNQKDGIAGIEIHFFCIQNGRVAIIDDLGSRFNLDLGILLVGERPGLSSPDSMGVYLTYQPRLGLTDDSRNCISNIRPEGLAPIKAAQKLIYLMKEALQLKLSGVNLKDRSGGSNILEFKTKVKICGVRNSEDAVYIVEMGADLIGLNLSLKSKRNINLQKAQEIAQEIRLANDRYSKDVKIVILAFQNPIEEIEQAYHSIQPDYIQLVYSDSLLEGKWEKLISSYPILPSINAKETKQLSELPFKLDQLLVIDSPSKDKGGGTGETFAWDEIQNFPGKYLLAGGLNPENVGLAVSQLHPWGVDVASGVEDKPGHQSREKILQFIQNAKRIS